MRLLHFTVHKIEERSDWRPVLFAAAMHGCLQQQVHIMDDQCSYSHIPPLTVDCRTPAYLRMPHYGLVPGACNWCDKIKYSFIHSFMLWQLIIE